MPTKGLFLSELRKNLRTKSTAMTAGIDYSTGRYIALLDGDLQNDPNDIPGMLDLLKREDWDVVAGNRKNRKDGMFPPESSKQNCKRTYSPYDRRIHQRLRMHPKSFSS